MQGMQPRFWERAWKWKFLWHYFDDIFLLALFWLRYWNDVNDVILITIMILLKVWFRPTQIVMPRLYMQVGQPGTERKDCTKVVLFCQGNVILSLW